MGTVICCSSTAPEGEPPVAYVQYLADEPLTPAPSRPQTPSVRSLATTIR